LLDRVPLPFGERAPLRRPFQPEKKFLDAVRMKQVVQGDVPKHDEHRIVAVLPVLGRSCPDVWWKCPKPGDEGLAVFDI
jgi:hypothetical protein